MKEKSIEASVIAWVKTQGGVATKVEARGERGWPDLDIRLPGGRAALVEMKQPGGKSSPQQARRLRTLSAMGHLAFVAESLDEVKWAIGDWYG